MVSPSMVPYLNVISWATRSNDSSKVGELWEVHWGTSERTSSRGGFMAMALCTTSSETASSPEGRLLRRPRLNKDIELSSLEEDLSRWHLDLTVRKMLLRLPRLRMASGSTKRVYHQHERGLKRAKFDPSYGTHQKYQPEDHRTTLSPDALRQQAMTALMSSKPAPATAFDTCSDAS